MDMSLSGTGWLETEARVVSGRHRPSVREISVRNKKQCVIVERQQAEASSSLGFITASLLALLKGKGILVDKIHP